MLRVDNITFNYKDHPVFENISFSVKKGQLCGLFGPNGCGKTTLFKCCMNFLKYENGTIYMDGHSTKNMEVSKLSKLVAYVPQEHKPPFPYIVYDMVKMGRTTHMTGFLKSDKKDIEMTEMALNKLGISHLAKKPYTNLSGGQRQLVLVARALAQQTKIIILDEPTSALDFKNQILLWEILSEIKEMGITILACSHDPNFVSWFCDHVIVMSRSGKIIKNGPPSEAITGVTLREIYGDVCAVERVKLNNVVVPKSIFSI